MSGIREAQAGFLGMSSALTATIAGLGLAVVAGKSILEITEKREKADNDLAQALKTQNLSLSEANRFLNTFIDTNRAYISDQSEVVDGYAALLRSGIPVAEAQKDMNRALDLAALKNISVQEATNLLILAEHGRTRGLIDLGITTAKYTDAQGNVINQGKNMALVMAEVDQRTAGARDTTTQTTQATNKLSNDWQDIANNVGPPLLSLLAGVLQGADFLVQKLKELGANKDWANVVSAGFGAIQTTVVGLIDDVKTLVGWLQDAVNWLHATSQASSTVRPPMGRQSGGPVFAGGIYTVGESGPETLVMGAGGGMVIPGGGGSNTTHATSVHIHIDSGAFIDGPSVDRLANLILQRVRFAPGK
jgi:hypothetical protein